MTAKSVTVHNPAPVAGTRAVGGRDRCNECGAVVDVDTIDGRIVDLDPGTVDVHECPTDEPAETSVPAGRPPIPKSITYMGRCFTWRGSPWQWGTFLKIQADKGHAAAIRWAHNNKAVTG